MLRHLGDDWPMAWAYANCSPCCCIVQQLQRLAVGMRPPPKRAGMLGPMRRRSSHTPAQMVVQSADEHCHQWLDACKQNVGVVLDVVLDAPVVPEECWDGRGHDRAPLPCCSPVRSGRWGRTCRDCESPSGVLPRKHGHRDTIPTHISTLYSTVLRDLACMLKGGMVCPVEHGGGPCDPDCGTRLRLPQQIGSRT